MKDSKLKDYQISLLFIEDNSTIDQRVEIEKNYIKGKLLDAQENE